MEIYTDIAAEMFGCEHGGLPAGVTVSTQSENDITVTRVSIENDNLAKTRGIYTTIDMPNMAYIDDHNEKYITAVATQLKALLPREGLILVAGLGNPAVTADALGPRTAEKIFVTRHLDKTADILPLKLREVASFAPGVEGKTGMQTGEVLRSIVKKTSPACVICVDSLCTASAQRLGCTVQITNAALVPKSNPTQKINSNVLGVPVIAAGVPTVMQAGETIEGAEALVVCPKEIDAIIRRGSNVLSLAINKALQTKLAVSELAYLTI
ncbi:MAG: GPR endopeptidase [Oscillospiraceae bacterium]|nr:GPR endopeptidase [Oscillospiraceae bacterium]